MEKNILKNINKNQKLSEKLELLLQNEDINSQYEMCQSMLEYINVNFICVHLKRNIPDYNILTIILEYKKIDQNLYDQMLSINAKYHELDESHDIEEYDIEYLLLKIDYIYGYMIEKYEVIK